jgi:hypothetical protein
MQSPDEAAYVAQRPVALPPAYRSGDQRLLSLAKEARERAEEILLKAETFKDAYAKQKMREIAAAYVKARTGRPLDKAQARAADLFRANVRRRPVACPRRLRERPGRDCQSFSADGSTRKLTFLLRREPDARFGVRGWCAADATLRPCAGPDSLSQCHRESGPSRPASPGGHLRSGRLALRYGRPNREGPAGQGKPGVPRRFHQASPMRFWELGLMRARIARANCQRCDAVARSNSARPCVKL